ncbi:MAG: hypothetical protein PHT51_03720 [Patescibacteria group bacterium]|nr:hypothetical protein [Patescibacteria group bacterium]MDD4611320.1 hypothetical protein [Patescibacteria group bacterium]
MNKKILTVVLFLAGALIITSAGCANKNNSDTQKQTNANPAASDINSVAKIDEKLSEQPNKDKYDEFFSEVYIAKLPVGAEFNPWKIEKTKIFAAGEQFCTSMNIKKQIPADSLSTAIYDVNAKQDIKPRMGTFPQALGPGNSTGCEPVIETGGKYEYKIYLGDIVVAVIPFEVK